MTPTTFNFSHGDTTFSFDMEIDPAIKSQQNLYVYATNSMMPEPEVCELMVRAVKPGDIVIDAGANLGFFSLLLAKLVGEHGWVLAFEPDASNMKYLCRNIQLNKLLNVQVVTAPLWSRAKAVMFHEKEDGGESCIVDPSNLTPAEDIPRGTVTKWATPMDQQELSKTPKLVKIDVEGAEHEVLKGAEKFLAKRPPYIIAEMNPWALEQLGSSQSALREFMSSKGYETFLLQEEGRLPIRIPVNTTLFPSRDNTNLLYSTIYDVGALWPELQL